MKHRFLLDENVLYHAIRGVDKHDNPDYTCAQLLLSIVSNCHRIVVSPFLRRRYSTHLERLKREPPKVLPPTFVLGELIYNSAKFVSEDENPPHLPGGCGIPAEDVEVVRAALISRPIFVTAEDNLRAAINGCAALHLRAIDPLAALVLAQDI